jgi:pyridoxine 5-phosphate synthase
MTELGVNVDHVATVRNARGGREPDPVTAALLAEMSGADSIVCHLREDRRHIRDDDVRRLNEQVQTFVQLEMTLEDGVIEVALGIKPREVMIVPERREELTTEGGFDCIAHGMRLQTTVKRFADAGIGVSVFIDPDLKQVEAAHKAGVNIVELHTGPYAHAAAAGDANIELAALQAAHEAAEEAGLVVHAGHGLNYHNVRGLLDYVPVEKVNIGHSIVSRAVFSGFEQAVRDMKAQVAGM